MCEQVSKAWFQGPLREVMSASCLILINPVLFKITDFLHGDNGPQVDG